MARKPKQPKAAQPADQVVAESSETASEGSADADEVAEQPEQDVGPLELSLHDALHQLTDDHRMRPHWEGSIRKFANNHGLGETATAEKWRECLRKYGVKLK